MLNYLCIYAMTPSTDYCHLKTSFVVLMLAVLTIQVEYYQRGIGWYLLTSETLVSLTGSYRQ